MITLNERAQKRLAELEKQVNPDADGPELMKFLKTSLQTENQIKIAFQWVGVSMLPQIIAPKLFVLVGPPNSGKTIFLDMIEGFIKKENVSRYSMDSLINEPSAGRLHEKLINISDDNCLERRHIRSKTLQVLLNGDDDMNPFANLFVTTHKLPVGLTDNDFDKMSILYFSAYTDEKKFDFLRNISYN